MHDFGEKCPRHFPGKISRNFRNFRNFPKFPRNFPGIFPDFPRFFNDEKHDFRSVSLCFTSKNPPIFREFSGNFPEIFGENFREFSEFRKFSGNFSRNFPRFSYFLQPEKDRFSLCIIVFGRKKPPEFPGNFPEKFLPGIFDISEISRKVPRNFSWFSLLLY